jgi:Tat protein translocase TatC
MTAEAAREPEELPRMSFGDHLDELRRRLLISLAAITVAVLGLLPFKTEVTGIYVQPYRQMWDLAFSHHVAALEAEVEAAGGLENLHRSRRETVEWIRDYKDEIYAGTYPEPGKVETFGYFRLPYALKATGGLEDFWIFMAASLVFGLVLASPVVLWQVWAFVASGLYAHERKVVYRYFPFAVGLLIAGVLFGYFAVVPFGLYFLITMMNWFQIEPMLSVAQYFSFLLTLTAALGAVFQLPLMMLALVKVGIVQHRTLVTHWRYVVMVIFLIAAVATPPDPFTMLLMGTPMTILYGVGLLLTRRVGPKGPRAVDGVPA